MLIKIMIKPFNKYAKEYNEWFDKNRFVFLSELKLIKKLIPKKGKGMDIGCGTGMFTVPLNIKIGTDPSGKMKRYSQERGIKVYSAKAERLPFLNNSFDFILLVTTLCFLDNVNKAFAEIYRILKPQGSFILGFVDKQSIIGKYYLKNKDKSKFYKYARFFSVKEVKDLLNKHNFSILDIRQTLFSLPASIKNIEKNKKGFGEGSFIGIKAVKEVFNET